MDQKNEPVHFSKWQLNCAPATVDAAACFGLQPSRVRLVVIYKDWDHKWFRWCWAFAYRRVYTIFFLSSWTVKCSAASWKIVIFHIFNRLHKRGCTAIGADFIRNARGEKFLEGHLSGPAGNDAGRGRPIPSRGPGIKSLKIFVMKHSQSWILVHFLHSELAYYFPWKWSLKCLMPVFDENQPLISRFQAPAHYSNATRITYRMSDNHLCLREWNISDHTDCWSILLHEFYHINECH